LDILGVNSQDTPGWGAAAERIQNLELGSPDFAELPLAQRSAEAGGEAETALSENGSASPGNEEETLSVVDYEELEIYILVRRSDSTNPTSGTKSTRILLRSGICEIKRLGAKKKKKQQQQQQNGTSDGAESASGTGSTSKSRRSHLPAPSSCTQPAMMALSKKGKVSTNRIDIEALESLFS